MVQNALRSILDSDYKNWELAFIDDSSPTPGRPVCEDLLKDHLDQVKFYNTNMTPEEKKSSNGMVGQTMNKAVQESDADVAIMLCDDDALCPDYLKNLNDFFESNPDALACYSHVFRFNPAFENIEFVRKIYEETAYTADIRLAGSVDASQVAWRTSVHDKNVWFEEKRTKYLDYQFYTQLDEMIKGVPFSGFFAQYKGVHPTMLENHETDILWFGNTIDIPDCERTTSPSEICAIVEEKLKNGYLDEARRICDKGIELHPAETDLYKLLSIIH